MFGQNFRKSILRQLEAFSQVVSPVSDRTKFDRLNREQLISALIDSNKELERANYEIESMNEDKHNIMRQILGLSDAVCKAYGGDLSVKAEARSANPGFGCVIEICAESYNSIVNDFTEALHQLPPDHPLLKKYKLNNYIDNCLLIHGIKLELLHIPAGEFIMGAPDALGNDRELPQHKVNLKEFLLGKYPVTQAQYETLMGNNPSHFRGNNLPVDSVSWNDANQFCLKLSATTGRKVYLPSESQWEYAAKGGNQSQGYTYAGSNNIDEVAWYDSNSSSQTHPVGSKKPNELGLYDMSGNVWEWCEDGWHENYNDAPTDGSAQANEEPTQRLLRGGSWNNSASNSRSTSRHRHNFYNSFKHCGFRLAVSIE